MNSRSVAVRIHASNGGAPGEGAILLRVLSFGERLRRAAVALAVGVGASLLVLPIPLVHFFVIVALPAACFVAVRRLASREVLEEARGTCPSCGNSGRFLTGLSWRGSRLPVGASCPKCGMPLSLDTASRFAA